MPGAALLPWASTPPESALLRGATCSTRTCRDQRICDRASSRRVPALTVGRICLVDACQSAAVRKRVQALVTVLVHTCGWTRSRAVRQAPLRTCRAERVRQVALVARTGGCRPRRR